MHEKTGTEAKYITGQELLARSTSIMNKPHFWVHEKKQSGAEISYIIQHNGKPIPIKVNIGSHWEIIIYKDLNIQMEFSK